ncbi:hypothetical protein JCM1840_004135 [Sporobolomyces johnsonii]
MSRYSATGVQSDSSDDPIVRRRSSSRAAPLLRRPPSKSRYDYERSVEPESGNSSDGSIGSSAVEEGRRKKKGKVHVMRSLGIQHTRLKDILPGSERAPSSSSTTTPLVDPTAKKPLPIPSPSGGGEKESSDLESQALAIRSARRRTSRLPASRQRILHITLAGLVCVALVVVGIVLGVKAYKHRGDSEGTAVDEAAGGSQVDADQASLLQEGESVQASLGTATNANAGEGHAEEETSVPGAATATTAAASEPSAVFTGGGGQASFLSPTVTVSPSPARPTNALPIVALPSPSGVYAKFPELQALLLGNREFVNETEVEDPGLLEELAEGQDEPKFAYLGCADSRVAETTVLGAKVGDLFVVRRKTRNVGNQYLMDDLSSETVMSYAIAHLGVQHIIVMGHTQCGAIRAAICTASTKMLTDIGENRVDAWIRPIRSLYARSNRTEIVSFRREAAANQTVTPDDVTDDVWNALVEENVKINVERLAADPSVTKAWQTYLDAQQNSTGATATATSLSSTLHGWVYDVSTGLVSDLVSPDWSGTTFFRLDGEDTAKGGEGRVATTC